ncbi:hypothetical protein [Photobacterium angustum]|uniref:hypothetical protein n=1 Tax=Photobacterium angustum TaxID=661 RepID=UPI000A477DCB|nr:hypothetical protein [Photobacterium angustum]
MVEYPILFCEECNDKHEWILVAVNPIDNGKKAVQVICCSNCGNEKSQMIS